MVVLHMIAVLLVIIGGLNWGLKGLFGLNFVHSVNDYTFNLRFRYRLDFQRSLWRKDEKQLWVQFGNEVMINAGKSIQYNYFDQNRTYGGLMYDLNKSFSVQAQFMYIWQQLSNGVTLDKISVIRFNVYHRINFKNGNKNTK